MAAGLLLHACCGPCATVVAEHFRGLGYEVTGWFFNPNVHPRDELARREAAFEEAARALALPALARGLRCPSLSSSSGSPAASERAVMPAISFG